MSRSYLKDYEVAYIEALINNRLHVCDIRCDNVIFPQSSFVSVTFMPDAACAGEASARFNVPINLTARPLVDHIAERCIMDIANYLKNEYVYRNKEDI